MAESDAKPGESSKPESSEQTGSQPVDGNEAGSKAESPAASADETPSMGDAIKAEMNRINDASQDRLEKQTSDEGEEESPTSGKSGDEPGSKKDGDDDQAGEEADEDAKRKKAEADDKAEMEWLSQQKEDTAKRFKTLTGKLKSSNEENAQVREQIAQQSEAVERMTAFNRWVNEEAGFKSTKQWNEFLAMGALINNDPVAALDAIEGYAQQLRENLGMTGKLPEDLQQRLDDGLIDEASARELARARRSREIDTTTRQEQARRSEHREAVKKQREFTKSISDAVNEAEKTWRAKDPDYDALAPDVKDKVVAMLQREGRDLKTPEDAVDLFDRAVKAVKKLAKLGQQQREIRQPGPGNAGGGNNAATEEAPKSMLDAMKRAYAGGGQAS